MVNPKTRILCFAVVQQGPLWIIFERNMIIELRQELLISSNKIIEGRGANVQIKNGGGLTMHDAISIFRASNIWIDHVFLSDSTVVTISNCHMTKHNDVMLFEARYQHQAIMS
ncbi:putative pectate lyase 3, partial [Mucuna pruriens]